MRKLHLLSLPTPFPIGPVNVYIAEGEALTLIDTGPKTEAARSALLSGLADMGYSFADIKQIILTHHHVDHVGLTAEIVAQSGAQVFTHPDNLAWLANDQDICIRHGAFYQQFWRQGGVPNAIIDLILHVSDALAHFRDPILQARPLPEGAYLRFADCDWRVFHTPGHAGGLICLWHAESRTLISNDHILKDISSNPILEPPMPGESERPRRLLDYLRELQRIAKLNPQIAYPGHGEIVYAVRELVADRLAFHRRRAQAIFEALGKHQKSLWELTQEIFPVLDDGADFFLGISEMQGHLDLLQNDKRIAETLLDGRVLWHQL
jgi:glyoxylase-like metal-dependent hydrolase (beta-lactamase superfamily II)